MKFSTAVAAFGVAHAALAAPAPANKRQGGLFGGLFGYSAQLPSGFPSELPSGFPTPTGRFPFATGGFPGTPSASILPTVAVPSGKIPGELEPPVKRDFPFTSGSFPATPRATGLPTQAVPAGKIPGEPPVKRDFPFTSGSFPATPSATGLPTQAVPAGKIPGHHPIRNFDSVVRRNLDLFGSEGKEEGYFLGFPAASGSFPTATAYGHPSATPSGTYPSGVASGFPF